jgi:alginate O-acetyltransferase complex protein AlgI
MLFNSFEFLFFFPFVFVVYWFVVNRNLKLQNAFLLVVSYVFYGWWDWRFVFLLILSTLIDYSFGLIIERTTKKKLYLWLSIFNNLAILGFFKYYNFFADSVADGLTYFGFHPDIYLLSIVLPVGISFYTFHGMSYVIDIYNGKSKPITDFVSYAVFVCFFPLLVAGPIERAHHLLPQVLKPRKFLWSDAKEGVRLILWGFFKKVVIADNLGLYVNDAFNNYQSASSVELVFGVIFFAFQIYCDFSGYSDIALGTARLLGFELMINFKTPYFARDIAEFWRRWHISLTTWFRDYLYIPLGGSKGGRWQAIRNTFIIFIVSGFWHGANWTFIVWGALNAIYFVPLLLSNKNRSNLDTVASNSVLPSAREFVQMITTFLLICSTWVFFRAATVTDAIGYFKAMFVNKFLPAPGYFNIDMITLAGLLFVFIAAEWTTRLRSVGVLNSVKNRYVRYAIYYILVLAVFLFGSFREAEFIYFQF